MVHSARCQAEAIMCCLARSLALILDCSCRGELICRREGRLSLPRAQCRSPKPRGWAISRAVELLLRPYAAAAQLGLQPWCGLGGPREPLRRRRPFATPESARDAPGRPVYLRRTLRTMREPPGRSGRRRERGVNDSVHSSLRSYLDPLYSQHVHRVVRIDRAARASCRTCDGDILSARDGPEPTLGSMYIVSQKKCISHRCRLSES